MGRNRGLNPVEVDSLTDLREEAAGNLEKITPVIVWQR